MTPAELIARRRNEWAELELIIATFTRNRRRRATAAELSRFAALFRDVCADLARARAQSYPEDLVDYLNALAARSHNIFYTAPPARAGGPWRFYAQTFPRAMQRNARYVVAGLLLFFVPFTSLIGLARADEEALFQLMPKQALEMYERMYERGHAEGRSEDQDLGMTGFYLEHNIGIAFRCFATGIFFGLGSIFMLIFNGLGIGAVVGFLSKTPSAMNLLSFIAGHGPFELFAICISGAAGLRLGFGAIITGARRRRDSLRDAALDAVRLVLGAATLLLGAAVIEGFFSPSSLPMAVKFGFGGLCVAFLVWYCGIYPARLVRRKGPQEQGA